MTSLEEIKERMATGFKPSDAAPEHRVANALEYIAFYLERIDGNIQQLSHDAKGYFHASNFRGK